MTLLPKRSNLSASAADASSGLSLKTLLAFIVAGLLCMLLTILAFAPAVWLSALLEYQTEGRFALGDAQGSIWNGSAFIGVAANKNAELTPLLPGRFVWHVSPILLLGQIELNCENSAALLQPLNITGNLHHIQINPGGLLLPAERLSGLGAPLNTLRPAGEVTLSWNVLALTLVDGKAEVEGSMKLSMQNMASALSPVKPLGSYEMAMLWHGQKATLELKTLQGPMLLSGRGALNEGHLHFSGQAEAAQGQEDRLANLLNLLGQRRNGTDKNVIALEFN